MRVEDHERLGPERPLRCATILPPSERFAPGEAGAISLLVKRMAQKTETVLGQPPLSRPFSDIRFEGVKPLWRPYSSSLRYAAALAAKIKTLKPDLLEIHNRPDIALALRRRFPALPIMLVLHNDPCGMRRAKTGPEREKLAQRVAVVGVSHWVRERFLSQNVVGTVRVLPNSIAMAEIPASPAMRDNVILFAGRVVADKGADAFVAACAQLLPQYANWRAEMIGADRFGPNSPQTPFLEALTPQARAAHVLMHGYKPHADVLQAMAQAAIVVVPSRWAEPFGMVALEALACGAALLVSDRGGLPDVVGKAGVYCNPDALPQFVEALESLMKDAPLRASLGVAARKQAQQFDVSLIQPERSALHRAIVQDWRSQQKI